MNVRLIFPFLSISFLLAGCEDQPQMVVLPSGRGFVRPVSTANAATTVGPIGSAANVRQAELVKVYGVNRYVDPTDPRILHERHAIYRVEQQTAWITRAKKQQGEVILGPLLGLH